MNYFNQRIFFYIYFFVVFLFFRERERGSISEKRCAIIFRAPESRFFLFSSSSPSFFSVFFLYTTVNCAEERIARGGRQGRAYRNTRGYSRQDEDLPRNRSTCFWHQKPMLTTSNNSSKPSVLSLSLSRSRL